MTFIVLVNCDGYSNWVRVDMRTFGPLVDEALEFGGDVELQVLES